MRKMLSVLWLVMLLIPMNAQTADALSCAMIPTIEEAYSKYDGVIQGRVEEVTRQGQENHVTIQVLKSYKGIDSRSVTVSENVTWGAMDGPSEVSEEYLFYLKKQGDTWEHPLCAPTKKAAYVLEEQSFLSGKEIALEPDINEPGETGAPSAGGGDPGSDPPADGGSPGSPAEDGGTGSPASESEETDSSLWILMGTVTLALLGTLLVIAASRRARSRRG